MTAVTQILDAIEIGDTQSAAALLPLVYDELRKLAASQLACEKPGQTLQPTALVSEAYIRLVGKNVNRQWKGQNHFFYAAAEAMRLILIDLARHKGTLKAGSGRRVDLDSAEIAVDGPDPKLLALDEAIRDLESVSERGRRCAAIVKLRFFGGLTIDQAAEAVGVSASTSEKDWKYARSWLKVRMSEKEDDCP